MKKVLAAFVSCVVLSAAVFVGGCGGSDADTAEVTLSDGNVAVTPTSFSHTHSHSGDYSCPPDRVGTITIANNTTWPVAVLIEIHSLKLRQAAIALGYSDFTLSAGDTISVPVVLNCMTPGTFSGDIRVHVEAEGGGNVLFTYTAITTTVVIP